MRRLNQLFLKDAETSVVCSNQGVEVIQHAAPSATPVPGEGKTEAGSVESLQNPLTAKGRGRKTLQNQDAILGINASSKAASAPKNPTTFSNAESVIFSDPKKPEGSQDEREGGSESGKAVQGKLIYNQ